MPMLTEKKFPQKKKIGRLSILHSGFKLQAARIFSELSLPDGKYAGVKLLKTFSEKAMVMDLLAVHWRFSCVKVVFFLILELSELYLLFFWTQSRN